MKTFQSHCARFEWDWINRRICFCQSTYFQPAKRNSKKKIEIVLAKRGNFASFLFDFRSFFLSLSFFAFLSTFDLKLITSVRLYVRLVKSHKFTVIKFSLCFIFLSWRDDSFSAYTYFLVFLFLFSHFVFLIDVKMDTRRSRTSNENESKLLLCQSQRFDCLCCLFVDDDDENDRRRCIHFTSHSKNCEERARS